MNVSCLNIRQEYAKIDIRNQNAQFDISARLGDFDMNTQPAVLDIRTERGGLEINNYPCRYAIGIKNNADFMSNAAQEGMQAFQEFTARIVNNSKQFSQSPANSATAVANIAVNNARPSQPPPRINLKYIDRPQYNYTPDKVNISYQMGRVNTIVSPAQFENNSQRGSVTISMAQWPSIRMWVTEGKFDMYA